MIRQSWKRLLFGIVVVATLLATVDAKAGWCYRPVYFSWSPCVSVCNPCVGWYAAYRAYPVRWAGCGCGYRIGSCCGSCGYTSCYASYSCCGDVTPCCGATTSQPATTGPTPAKKPAVEAPSPTPAAPAPAPGAMPEPGATPTLPTPNEPTPATPAPEVPTPPTTTSSATPETSGVLTVWVPYDAKVTINGRATSCTGSRRQFVSYGLNPGFSYKYEIHAEVIRDGKLVEDNRTVTLTAGQTTAVAFGFNTNPAEAVASTK